MYEGPGRYEHYKGGQYRVLGLSVWEATVSKPGEAYKGTFSMYGPMGKTAEYKYEGVSGSLLVPAHPVYFVIYEPLTPGSLLETEMFAEVSFWARPLDDFNENIQIDLEDTDAELVPRFRKFADIPHDVVDRPLLFKVIETTEPCSGCGKPIHPGQAWTPKTGRHLGC